MPKDKHGTTKVSHGDILKFKDGTLERVVDYAEILHIKVDYDVWQLTEFDPRDYEIIEKGDENKNELS